MRIRDMLRASRWIVLAVVLAAAAGATTVYLWRGFERPLPMSADRVEVRIANGASARAIARAIRAAGVDLNELEFVAAVRASGATRSLRAGRYAIENGMSMRSVVEMIQQGNVLLEQLTIPEGVTFRDLREQFDSTPELQHQSAKLGNAELLRAIGAPEKDPEGLFAPDTYLFDPGSSDLDLYRRAYRMQAARVEKETGQPDERRRVASVFVNRQRLGMPLQTDPSVIYGLGDRFEGRLHRKDLGADTPYNTYTRPGLPPTPIALPGQASIEAALNPETTRDLYFVARGDGTSQFSATLAEHQRAVDRFQRIGARPAASESRHPVAD